MALALSAAPGAIRDAASEERLRLFSGTRETIVRLSTQASRELKNWGSLHLAAVQFERTGASAILPIGENGSLVPVFGELIHNMQSGKPGLKGLIAEQLFVLQPTIESVLAATVVVDRSLGAFKALTERSVTPATSEIAAEIQGFAQVVGAYRAQTGSFFFASLPQQVSLRTIAYVTRKVFEGEIASLEKAFLGHERALSAQIPDRATADLKKDALFSHFQNVKAFVRELSKAISNPTTFSARDLKSALNNVVNFDESSMQYWLRFQGELSPGEREGHFNVADHLVEQIRGGKTNSQEIIAINSFLGTMDRLADFAITKFN